MTDVTDDPSGRSETSRRLDVAVNLLWLAPGRVGGSEQYLVRQLAGLPAGCAIFPRLLVQPSFAGAHPGLATRFDTRALPFGLDWRGARIIAEHTWLAARTRSVDVIHHGGGTVPILGPRPIVLTIHDLQYLTFPHYFSQARRAYLQAMMPRSARRATVITTPSTFVRDTVIEAFGIAPDRAVVVPHGVPDHDRPTSPAVQAARDRVGLGSRPYVVYPAITHPHKGHRVLIDMLRHVDRDLALLLLGGIGGAEPDVQRAIRDAGVADRVVRPGRVNDADRDALVAGAEALVFPSEYEGFGAPLVEAMMLGTPIVCGGHAAIREVVGDAAVIVETRDGAEWSDALTQALSSGERLIAAGRARLASYTLDVSGAALAAAYRRAAAAWTAR